jgi:hypothetical protein
VTVASSHKVSFRPDGNTSLGNYRWPFVFKWSMLSEAKESKIRPWIPLDSEPTTSVVP